MTRTRSFEWSDPLAVAKGSKGKTGLEFLRAIIAGELPAAPISRTLDFDIISADEGVVRFRGKPAEFHYNPMGSVHGGFAATILDSAMGSAVMSTCDEKSAYTTVELSVSLTAPISATTGPITAEGKIIHRGKRIATAEGRLTDDKGTLLAHGTTTCLIFPRPD